MQRIVIALAVLLVWPNAALAADLMVKVPVDEYQATKTQLNELQKQLAELEKKLDQPRTAEPAAEEYSDSKLRKLDRDISFIYDTLDQVETAALLDRISFGAEVRVRMDNYRVKNYVGAYVDFSAPTPTWTMVAVDDERNDGNWSSRFRINMDAEVSESITFAGRLALYKNWADSMGATFMSTDNNRAHVSDGTTDLKVDRFYIDWTPKFVTPIGISFGRLPTSDGPPLEYKEDRKRQSIYPALIFDGEPDGIVVTAGLERYIRLKNSGLRYFYAKATQYDAEHLSMNYLDTVWMDPYKDTDVQAVFFETEVPGLRDSLLVLSYVPATNILMQSPAPSATGKAIDNLGDITLYGVHFQVPNLYGSGLDLFASYGENRNEPNGRTIDFAGANFGLFSGGGAPLAVDAAPTGTTTGRAWYAGLRYELPIGFLNRPKLGFEYNRGNKYWFSFTPGSGEIFNRLATRGEAFDVYYIQPFNQHLFLRTGYTKITYEATGSGMPFGQPTEYKEDMGLADEPEFHNFYILLDSRF